MTRDTARKSARKKAHRLQEPAFIVFDEDHGGYVAASGEDIGTWYDENQIVEVVEIPRSKPRETRKEKFRRAERTTLSEKEQKRRLSAALKGR